MTPALAVTTATPFAPASMPTMPAGVTSRRDQLTRFGGGSGRVTTARPFRIQARVNLQRLATATPATAAPPATAPVARAPLPAAAPTPTAAVVPMAAIQDDALMAHDAEPGDELVVLADAAPAGLGGIIDDEDDDTDDDADMGGAGDDDVPVEMGGLDDDAMEVEDDPAAFATTPGDGKENAPEFVPLRSPTFDEPTVTFAKAAKKPRGPANQRLKQALKLRQSLANNGTRVEEATGVRRSTRQKVRPLEWWRNEHVVYGREHRSLASVVGVSLRSPDPLWPRNAPRVRKAKAKARTGGKASAAGAAPPPPPPQVAA